MAAQPMTRGRIPILEDPEGHEVAALARMVPSFTGLHVLEIGAGDGRLTRRYARGAASVIAIDPKAESIAALRADLPWIDARPCGIEGLVVPPHSIDVAIFSWSL
jgi:2-polyprenyl-3-methyl-5-hydroxy-6-metoxy-1,4-benzoquinol methylase